MWKYRRSRKPINVSGNNCRSILSLLFKALNVIQILTCRAVYRSKNTGGQDNQKIILYSTTVDGKFSRLVSATLITALAVIELHTCCAVYQRRNTGVQDNKQIVKYSLLYF